MDTRTQLLAAAETLFAEHGPEATSLREIARLAGQRNTAALHYHFGNREQLIQAWVSWRLKPVNRLRDRFWPQLPTDIPGLVERLSGPFLMKIKGLLAQEGHSQWLRCLARLDLAEHLSAPPSVPGPWQNSLLATLEALRQQLPPAHATWRVNLAFATLLRGLAQIEASAAATQNPGLVLELGAELEQCLVGLLAHTQPHAHPAAESTP